MASSLPQKQNRNGSRREERSARTRDRVLAVATELMARRGYSGTSISAISKAAGVMPASIYWHFDSKEGLLAAVIERAAEAWFGGAAEAMAADQTSSDPRAGLRYIFEEQPDFYCVLLLVGLERRHAGGPPLEAVQRVRERLRGKLVERLAERIELDEPRRRQPLAEKLADVAMVLLDGTFLAQQLDPAEGDALEARFERFRSTMQLLGEAFLAEAGGARSDDS